MTLPWGPLHGESRGAFRKAIRARGEWIAIGVNGRISTIRHGEIVNIASPSRDTWGGVWAAETGELFVTQEHNQYLVAMRKLNGAWQLWKREHYTDESIVGLSPNAVWAGGFLWNGTDWKPVRGLGTAATGAESFRVGARIFLRSGRATWQVAGDLATRTPALDEFSTLGGSGNWPDWGIRNNEIFRLIGKHWVHFAQARGATSIIAKGKETLFVGADTIMRVKGQGLIRLGDPADPAELTDYVGVAIEDGGVLALTSSGQELRLSEGQTQRLFVRDVRGSASNVGLPTVTECSGTEPAAHVDVSQTEPRVEERSRKVFARGDQQYAFVAEPGQVTRFEQFDGKQWSPWVPREIADLWGDAPNCIGGEPQANSEVWLGGCGYIIEYAKGQYSRHRVLERGCLRGFFHSSSGAYFYGAVEREARTMDPLLRRVGGSWVSETAATDHIDAMCERGGQIYATSGSTLLRRRAHGHFASATSNGDWSAGLREEEFGPFDGAAGSSKDGYLIVGNRVEHFDGSSWSEVLTDSGMGLRAIAQSQHWVLGLGKDGFLYQRDESTKGNRFLRQRHVNATSLIVESPTEATVASAEGIYRWDGQRWTEQQKPAHHPKPLQIVGFARVGGKLHAFESTGQVLRFENGSWQNLAGSDPLSAFPGSVDFSKFENEDRGGDNEQSLKIVSLDDLPRQALKPCVAFQPRPDVVVLVSCTSNWGATYDSGHWTSTPLPFDIGGNVYGAEVTRLPSSCLEAADCYVFGRASVVLKADRSAL